MTPQLEQRLREIEERCNRATPIEKDSVIDRIAHSGGEFTYEINDAHHLVAFYESNHKSPMKAKFNAELYLNARTDIPFLTSELRKAYEALECAREGLDKISSPHPNPGTLSDLEMLELFSDISGETIAQIAKILEER